MFCKHENESDKCTYYFLHTHWLQEEMESKDTQLQQKDEQLLQKERQLQEMQGTAPSTSEQQSAIAVSL